MCMCVHMESQGWGENCSVILALMAKTAPTAPCDVAAHKQSYTLSWTQPTVRKISQQKPFNLSCHAPLQWYECHGCTSECQAHCIGSQEEDKLCRICSSIFVNRKAFWITRILARKRRYCMARKKKKEKNTIWLSDLQNENKGYLAQQLTVPTDPTFLKARPVGFAAGYQPPEDTLISPGKLLSAAQKYEQATKPRGS